MEHYQRAESGRGRTAEERTKPHAISADEALLLLIAGNGRFVRGEARSCGIPRESLAELAQDQRPFATILGCSDSRVPPELIFDAGLGELFVVRIAGNVLSPEVAASLEYAGAHLQTPLCVVLGHEHCGAVSAALKARDEDELQRSRIHLLVDAILPALPKFDPRLSPEARLTQAVESNVRRTARAISASPWSSVRLAEGHMKAVGAVYDIASGRVRFLS